MQIVYGSPQSLYPPCALALGNFDGVHAGHQIVLNAALERAAEMGLAAAVAVFDPHPRRYFQPDAPPFRLMDDTQQAEALADLGFDRMHVLPFDTAMANMMPREFAEAVLSGWANVQHVYVGSDFGFGKGRSGDVAILTGIGEQIGFSVTGMALLTESDSKISSSRIRDLLASGKVADAGRLLGRPWTIRGAIDKGDQRGRTIGFPTANIAMSEYCRPKFGVYAVRMQIDDRILPGVANVGMRPTVGGTEERLEVHLFNFAEDIYGETVSVEMVEFLRPEQKFNGLDALKAQIAEDAGVARDILGVS